MPTLLEFERLAELLRMRVVPASRADWMLWHLREFYQVLPGLALTIDDVQRAFQSDRDTCALVLHSLVDVGFLRADGGRFVHVGTGLA